MLLVLVCISFISEALLDASQFYPNSKIWKYVPLKLSTPGAHVFKLDVFHLMKFIQLPALFLAGCVMTELTILDIVFMIMLRLIFFDRFLMFLRDWK